MVESTRWMAATEDKCAAFATTLYFPLYGMTDQDDELKLEFTVLDYRSVTGVRKGSRCIGSAAHDIASMTEQSGMSMQCNSAVLKLRRGGDDVKGALRIRYRIQGVERQQGIIRNTGRHSIAKVVKSLAPLLQAGNGVELILQSMPSSLNQSGAGTPRSSVHGDAKQVIEALASSSANLGDESDEQSLFALGELARTIVDFVVAHTDSTSDVTAITEEWIYNVLKHAAHAHEGPEPEVNRDRLRRFVESAAVRPQNLKPANAKLEPMTASGDLWKSISVPTQAVLGKGSFGSVWRAKDIHTGKIFAVKSLKLAKEGSLMLAQRESQVAQLLASKPHPCIVKLFHYFHDPGSDMYFLILEFCPKGDLNDQITRWKRQAHESDTDYEAPPVANAWLAHVFLGMHHAHKKMDTLLRDVKPANVIISGDNIAKLTDFGFSRIGAHHSGAFTFVHTVPAPGTPSFVAPEVILGESYGPAADLYSYGVLVWVCLTGGLEGKNVQAPCVSNWSATKLKKLAGNWQLLKACIQTPERKNVHPLPGGPEGLAASLVLSLTNRAEGSEHVSHEEIQQHEFWQCLHSPMPTSEDEVQNWVVESVSPHL